MALALIWLIELPSRSAAERFRSLARAAARTSCHGKAFCGPGQVERLVRRFPREDLEADSELLDDIRHRGWVTEQADLQRLSEVRGCKAWRPALDQPPQQLARVVTIHVRGRGHRF